MEDVLPATHAQEVPCGGHHSEAGETSWVWKGLEARLLCHHQWCSSLNRMLKLLTACFSCTRRQEHLGSLGPKAGICRTTRLFQHEHRHDTLFENEKSGINAKLMGCLATQ